MVNRVKEYRKQRGLSQQALAQRAGVSRGTVRNLENGKSEWVMSKTLLNIAKVLDVEIKDLIPDGQSVGA